jgi:MFS family permease
MAMRMWQGVGIDRIGPRQIWLWSTGLFIFSCLAHLAIRTVDGPAVYLLRTVYQSSLAGFFGASITYVSGKAPINRMAEMIGSLGTSGFVGMMIGTFLGRAIAGSLVPQREEVDRLFLSAAAMATLSFVFAVLATQGHLRRVPRRKAPPPWRLLRRYNPGLLLLMAVATGIGLNLPTVFLRAYMQDLELQNGVLFFFNLYPPIAFVTRVSMRSFPDRFGIRPMIALGLAAAVAGTLLFIPVRSTLDLIWPAVFMGIAHASLFPAVVAGGSGAFPARYRGLGTTLVLTAFDVGTFIGSPLAGELLTRADRNQWPKWPTTYFTVAMILAVSGLIYFGLSRKTPSRRGRSKAVAEVPLLEEL